MDVLRQDNRPPYIDCPVNECVIPVKQCLYNIDSVKDQAIIFEGVTGVWRWGKGALASFTANLTKEQMLLLAKKKVKKVFVLFDPDAKEKAENISIQLSGFIPSVEQIYFSSGDPKDLDYSSIAKLKEELGFL
jgi:5S rRNA maturation endonuclease (ribonuclease M5)